MTQPEPHANDVDRQRVADLLGREPQGQFEVVVRDRDGDPVVILNSPLLADGTPMPTRYWLVGATETRRIGTLEASGGVNAAEAAVDPEALETAHRRYAAERDAAIDANYDGPRPSGGVGGTRTGVKCLHSHWAWYLAGGDDPVGRWIEQQFEADQPTGHDTVDDVVITIGDRSTMVRFGNTRVELPIGVESLTTRWFTHDRPLPEDLTNALGSVDDELDDLDREHGTISGSVTLEGPPVAAITRLEIGTTTIPPQHVVSRTDLEEVFRIAATETTAERRDNPGLIDGDEVVVLPALCIALSVLRRYRLAEVCLVELG